MKTFDEKLKEIENLTLEAGEHDSPEEGMCVMEAGAVVAQLSSTKEWLQASALQLVHRLIDLKDPI